MGGNGMSTRPRGNQNGLLFYRFLLHCILYCIVQKCVVVVVCKPPLNLFSCSMLAISQVESDRFCLIPRRSSFVWDSGSQGDCNSSVHGCENPVSCNGPGERRRCLADTMGDLVTGCRTPPVAYGGTVPRT